MVSHTTRLVRFRSSSIYLLGKPVCWLSCGPLKPELVALRALRGTRGRMRSRMAFIPEPHDTLPYDLPWSAPSMRAVKIGLLLAMWYSSSIITSLTTKTILSHFPFPITLALVQQAVAAVLSYISWRWERGADPPAASRDRASIVTPIAGVMVLSLVRRTAQRTAHSAAG